MRTQFSARKEQARGRPAKSADHKINVALAASFTTPPCTPASDGIRHPNELEEHWVEAEAFASVHDLVHHAIRSQPGGCASLRQIYDTCEKQGRIAYKRSGGSRIITANEHWKSQIRHALYTSARFCRASHMDNDDWCVARGHDDDKPATTTVRINLNAVETSTPACSRRSDLASSGSASGRKRPAAALTPQLATVTPSPRGSNARLRSSIATGGTPARGGGVVGVSAGGGPATKTTTGPRGGTGRGGGSTTPAASSSVCSAPAGPTQNNHNYDDHNDNNDNNPTTTATNTSYSRGGGSGGGGGGGAVMSSPRCTRSRTVSRRAPRSALFQHFPPPHTSAADPAAHHSATLPTLPRTPEPNMYPFVQGNPNLPPLPTAFSPFSTPMGTSVHSPDSDKMAEDADGNSYRYPASNGTSGPPKKRHKQMPKNDSNVKMDLSTALGVSNVSSCSKPGQGEDEDEDEAEMRTAEDQEDDNTGGRTTVSGGSDAQESFRDPSRNKRKPAKTPVSVYVPNEPKSPPPAPRDGSRNRRKGKAERSSVDIRSPPSSARAAVATSSGKATPSARSSSPRSKASAPPPPPMDYGDANSQMGSSAEDCDYMDDLKDYVAPVAARTRAGCGTM